MKFNFNELSGMLEKVTLASVLPALLFLAAGLVLIRLVMAAATKALAKSSIDQTLHRFILTSSKLVLYLVLFVTVAGVLGIPVTSLVALLSVAGLAISLSLQSVLSSISCGVMLLSVKPFKVGDYVEVGGLSGTVSEIGFMNTQLTTFDRRVIYIPNNEVSTSKVINYTQEEIRRIDLIVKADYTYTVDEVKRALRLAVSKFPKVLDDPAPFIRVRGYDQQVEYAFRVWCKTPDYWELYFDLLEAVPGAFAESGLEMRPPVVNVRMRGDEKAAYDTTIRAE